MQDVTPAFGINFGRSNLTQLHDCEEGCFVFIVWTYKGLWGAEVNVGAQGCWSAGVHSQEWGQLLLEMITCCSLHASGAFLSLVMTAGA